MTTSKQKTEPTLAIVHYDHGSYTMCPASIDTARQLLESKLLEFPDEHYPALRLARQRKAEKDNPATASRTEYTVPDRRVLQLFKDLHEQPEDEYSELLHMLSTEKIIKGQKLPITKDIRMEFAYWALETKYHPTTADCDFLRKYQPEKFLSFLSGLKARAKGLQIKYYNAQDLQEADEIFQLLYGGWKPEAHVENVVNRYLEMLNAYSGRDNRYHIGEYHPGGFI
ncbi:hypothetical protein LC612_31390 [Nostoc sp. CHAB 5834]|nr:hypothetical protein [Nostoc sp. CHAB 5834]